MKNILLSLVLVLSAVSSYGQTTLLSRNDQNIAQNDFVRVQKQSTGNVSFGFQNLKYEHVTDMGYILLSKSETITLLQKMINSFSSSDDVYFETSNYAVMFMPQYPNSITLYDSDSKFTFFKKSELQKILNILKQ